jgi:nucleotide-binding universal stress UspA family protein
VNTQENPQENTLTEQAARNDKNLIMAMSLDSVLDEERREVLKLLEASASGPKRGSTSSGASVGRTSSPMNSPRSPVRSMLDIDEPRSSGMTSPPVRSMLDIDSPPPLPSLHSPSLRPTEAPDMSSPPSLKNRSHSDASRPDKKGNDPIANYQFGGILTSNPGASSIPKRNTQAGRKLSTPSAMAEVVRGTDLGGYTRDRGNTSKNKSRSPHGPFGLRSHSPHQSMLNTNSMNLMSQPGKYALDDGRMVDINSAYRRLSDANLALSGGSLSGLSGKGRRRTDSGSGGTRLEKDYTYQSGEDAVIDSSDDDHTSDEEGRGRRRGRRESEEHHPESQTIGMGNVKGPRQSMSLLAAAEEERQQISDKYKVRSLLEPEITVTDPAGQRTKPRAGIHPSTSFDQGGSGFNTPVTSDTEADITDIKRAQKLRVDLTPIISTPESHRCVRTIYRGDFAKMQQEAEDDHRRVRKYLVATDLSDEAAHALEWTIGTVLRDGDTLLAIYCIDEETSLGFDGHDESITTQAAIIAASATVAKPAVTHTPSRLGPGRDTASPARDRSKAESERHRAVDDITERVSKLLRKTRLQVRVVIEVIHCKSPKHLITEVIDFISPTLVILGSRGRSALKGYVHPIPSLLPSILTPHSVILGSFSNYLVTKSSVPVMVARKKLRKHNKYKRPAVRLANNLTNVSGRSLAAAKID